MQTTLSTNYYTKGDVQQTYASKTDLTQTANSIEQSVAETYQVKGDYPTTAAMNSAINQSASQIQSTVEENVMNSVGESYATKSELTQTSTDLKATFTAGLNTKGKMYVRQPTPPYSVGDVYIDPEFGKTYECTEARSSGSFSSNDWTQREDIVSGMVRLSGNGVEVGRSDSSYKTVTSNSAFSVKYNGTEVAKFAPNDTYIGSTISGNPYAYGTLHLYGGTITGQAQAPGGSVGGYMHMNANTVDIQSDNSDALVRCNYDGSVIIHSNGTDGEISEWIETCSTGTIGGNSVRYWEWAKERKEASGTVFFQDAGHGEHTKTITLPFFYSTEQSYRVFVQLMTNPLNGGSTFNLTKVFPMVTAVSPNRFTIYVWNDHSSELDFAIGWYTIGV